MRLFKFLLLIIISLIVIINSFHIETYNYNEDFIEVEVRGDGVENSIVQLNKGSTFSDLLSLINLNDDADISSYSLSMPLYNKEIIIINKENNEINKISINDSTKEQLMSLPGIGDKTADLIIKYREENNGFKFIEELMNIKGIGEKKFEKIKDRISL